MEVVVIRVSWFESWSPCSDTVFYVAFMLVSWFVSFSVIVVDVFSSSIFCLLNYFFKSLITRLLTSNCNLIVSNFLLNADFIIYFFFVFYCIFSCYKSGFSIYEAEITLKEFDSLSSKLSFNSVIYFLSWSISFFTSSILYSFKVSTF